MAFNVITPSNSRTVQLADLDANPYLLVTEGAYITDSRTGIPAYFANAGNANVTIKGTVITGGGYGGLYLGVQDSFTSGGGNKVTVSASGLVEGNNAMTLFGGGNWVVNDGMLRGFGVSDPGGIDTNKPGGVVMYGANNKVDNHGTITGLYGVYSRGDGAEINNSGTISATGRDAVFILDGTATIRNTGTIIGDVTGYGDSTDLYNSGVIQGNVFIAGAFVQNYGTITGSCGGNSGQDIISNYGSIESVSMFDGADYVFNRLGAIMGSVSFGGLSTPDLAADNFTNDGQVGSIYFDDSGDTFQNTGLVISQVNMGDGDNYVDNSGDIRGQVYGGAGVDSITNLGSISSVATGNGADVVINAAGASIRVRVFLDTASADADKLINDGTIGIDLASYGIPTILFGDGADDFENTGTVYGGVDMGAGNDIDTLTNSGRITGGAAMGAGNDSVDTSDGAILGRVDLGAGNDSYAGGNGIDRVIGGTGNDTIDLGNSNDVYFAVNADGKDDVDGGVGLDTYNASAATLSVSIDLSASTTALTIGNDLIVGFENVIGGSANDTLVGSDDANRIDGGAGADTVSGGDGGDRLLGGAGTDTITGGLGRDILIGTAAGGLNESDRFVFADGDSGTTSKTRDVIIDFTDHGSLSAPFATGADLIDLHLMDANTVAASNQAFSFNATSGAAFSGAAGSLVWQQLGTFALISGDTNGDGKADFVIQLAGVHALLASDFVL